MTKDRTKYAISLYVENADVRSGELVFTVADTLYWLADNQGFVSIPEEATLYNTKRKAEKVLESIGYKVSAFYYEWNIVDVSLKNRRDYWQDRNERPFTCVWCNDWFSSNENELFLTNHWALVGYSNHTYVLCLDCAPNQKENTND